MSKGMATKLIEQTEKLIVTDINLQRLRQEHEQLQVALQQSQSELQRVQALADKVTKERDVANRTVAELTSQLASRPVASKKG
jgi:hypothetical protein